jgi:hypothetical protein
MAKLPSSFRERNRTTRSFREQYTALPERIKEAVRDSCNLFDRDPAHPSLRLHRLTDLRGASHQPDSFSVSITMRYRAIYVVRGAMNIWYWIGTHADFDRFTGG